MIKNPWRKNCHHSVSFSIFVTEFLLQVANEIKAIKAELKKKKSLLQMDELKCRKRVLRRLGYCTAADVIELKGRVACEISRYVFAKLRKRKVLNRCDYLSFYVFNTLIAC